MMSQKMAVVVLAIPYPVCLLLFTFGLPVPVLYVMIFLIGITKGMITIINNHAIRQVTGSSNKYLNLLHMWYAVGAFLSARTPITCGVRIPPREPIPVNTDIPSGEFPM